MAPLCADPRQLVIALDPVHRHALLDLVGEIVTRMAAELETPAVDLGPVAPDDGAGGGGPATQTQTPQKPSSKEARQARRIQEAALRHMADWRAGFLPKLNDIVRVADSDKIRAERQARRDAVERKRLDDSVRPGPDVAALQALYPPVATPLVSIPSEDRREALACVLLLLLADGRYSALSRALVLRLASALELPHAFVNGEEAEVARALVESSLAADGAGYMSADAEAAERRQANKLSRFWKVGLASVAGAAVIGVTGGLAAPLVAGAIGGIMGGVGLGGVASFLGVFWMNGALVGALFGAYGAKMTVREAASSRLPPRRG